MLQANSKSPKVCAIGTKYSNQLQSVFSLVDFTSAQQILNQHLPSEKLVDLLPILSCLHTPGKRYEQPPIFYDQKISGEELFYLWRFPDFEEELAEHPL